MFWLAYRQPIRRRWPARAWNEALDRGDHTGREEQQNATGCGDVPEDGSFQE